MARTDELTGTPLSVRRIVALCCAGGLLDGFDLLIMGAALLALVPHYHLSGAETGVITSLPYIGAAVGALAAGRLNDRFGRRLICSAAASAASPASSSFVPSVRTPGGGCSPRPSFRP